MQDSVLALKMVLNCTGCIMSPTKINFTFHYQRDDLDDNYCDLTHPTLPELKKGWLQIRRCVVLVRLFFFSLNSEVLLAL